MGRQRVDNGYQNCAEIADYAGISEWAKLDLQSIQHRDYFGHLSIFVMYGFKYYAKRDMTCNKWKNVTCHFGVKLFSAVFNFSNILLKFLVARGLSVFLEIFCPFVYLKNMPCLASVLENVYVKVSSSKAWISAQVIVFAVLWISIFSLWVQSGSKYSTMY